MTDETYLRDSSWQFSHIFDGHPKGDAMRKTFAEILEPTIQEMLGDRQEVSGQEKVLVAGRLAVTIALFHNVDFDETLGEVLDEFDRAGWVDQSGSTNALT